MQKGDFRLCMDLIDANPDILLSTTPHKNNCLHIAAMLGHHEFTQEVWSRAPSLISGTNIDGETPLIAALMTANLSLASDITTAATQFMQHDNLEEGRLLNCMLLEADRRNENALHHAMRNGFEDFALQLLDIEPELSKQVTLTCKLSDRQTKRREKKYKKVKKLSDSHSYLQTLLEIDPRLSEQVTNTGELPMYMVARRGYSRVIERLLQIPSSAVFGPENGSAMHAAVEYDHPGMIKRQTRELISSWLPEDVDVIPLRVWKPEDTQLISYRPSDEEDADAPTAA